MEWTGAEFAFKILLMAGRFVTLDLDEIVVGEELPGAIYLYIDQRFVVLRGKGDAVDRDAYDRLEFRKMRTVFIQEADQNAFSAWTKKRQVPTPPPPKDPVQKRMYKIREDAHRQMLDIFQSPHPNRVIHQALKTSKNLVAEVMKNPFAAPNLAYLQSFSKGTAGHSVNVRILSVYLGMQMGYGHKVILQNLGVGGLLHDLGKTQVQVADDDPLDVVVQKMRSHPLLGVKLLEQQPAMGDAIPEEVKLIIAQHHECYDGTGYPKRLRGTQIYDLARLVSIANIFDELVSEGRGTLIQRQRAALRKMDDDLYKKFDPHKLEKAIRILRLGI